MHRRSVLRILRAALALPATYAQASKTWTILALGDSITAGGKSFNSYRGPLARMVQQAGFRVQWLGSQSTPYDEPQLHHEGYPGKPVEFLAANMNHIYRAAPADIILLHAGHNHTVEEHPIPGIIGSTRSIIRIARNVNPRVIVFVAQVIPSGKLPKYAYIPALNQQIAVLAAASNTGRSPVILVNQAEGFDPQSDTIADHVHPNGKGALKMAGAWFRALQSVLSGHLAPH
jgi:lysophospholipase L1-like esterase